MTTKKDKINWEIIKEQIKGIKDTKLAYFKIYQIGKQDGIQSQKEKIIEKIEKVCDKLNLLENYLDDLIEKTSYQMNISEHSGNMRMLIKECKELFKRSKELLKVIGEKQ